MTFFTHLTLNRRRWIIAGGAAILAMAPGSAVAGPGYALITFENNTSVAGDAYYNDGSYGCRALARLSCPFQVRATATAGRYDFQVKYTDGDVVPGGSVDLVEGQTYTFAIGERPK